MIVIALSKIRKSVKLFYLALAVLAVGIIASYLSYGEVKKNKIDYLHSTEIISLNNDIDRLFKDVVYLPLIFDTQTAMALEKEKNEQLNAKILRLKNVVLNELPNMSLVQEIEQNWIELKDSPNSRKLNILYDLEMLHNSLDRQESDKVILRQDTAAKNISVLLGISIAFSFFASVLMFFSLLLERKELSLIEKTLEKSNNSTKRMSTFLAIAGHELRTPLNGIIGLSEILRKSHLPEEEMHYVDNLYHSGKALLKIINNLLEFTRIESCKIELENAEFSLGAIVQQVVTTFSSEAREKNVKFTYLIDEEVPAEIYGDSSRLAQILFNLIGNAVNFTMNGSVILKVKVLKKDPGKLLSLYFSVEDTGIGLTDEQLKKLFRPITEIQISGKIGEIHPGLSFAICNQLVKAMGGEFEVTSKLGLGSKFSFTANFTNFSAAKLGSDFLKKYHYFDDHSSIRPIFDKIGRPTILVVDDNPANLLMVQVMLERLGAKIVTATNGKEAINEYPRSKIDLILMDCQMPVTDGYTATKILRQNDVHVPIIAMTATNTLEEQGKCLNAGMNSFIGKPIETETLIKELKKALYLEPESFSGETLEKLETSIGHEGMSKVVQAFLDDLPTSEQKLDQSLKVNDLEAIHNIGHRFKSASHAVGAKGLADLFKKLEKTENIEEVYEIKSIIHSVSANLQTKLTEHIKHLH